MSFFQDFVAARTKPESLLSNALHVAEAFGGSHVSMITLRERSGIDGYS